MAERPAAGRDVNGQNRQGTAVTDDAVSMWFIREIVPLEANLMHYLQHNWRNASDIPDLRQETYARVLEAARERIPDNPEHFLFVCARNLLIDHVRREQVVPMETFADLDMLGIASGAPGPDRLVIEREDLRRLEAALEQLPARTREAIALAYFEGLSSKDIAKRMGVTQPAASQFIANGALILGRILFGAPADRSAKS
jgi:RNA polymerase sigma factor (sigma-70 family)